MTGMTTNGVKAPPIREAAHTYPCALPTSPFSNQRLMTPVEQGDEPASPMPNMKRMTNSEARPPASPVNAVNSDHHSTMTARILRCPSRSPKAPMGICIKP